jgi:hydrogenase-4 component E
LHIAKKNFGSLLAYGVQSFIIVILLFNSFFTANKTSLLLVALIVLIVKVILAPLFINRLTKKHELKFSANTYVNTPLTLIIVAVLTALASSNMFSSLTGIIPDHQKLLALALSAIFISLFLIINRKGARSQIIGILSLENSIVLFGIFAGLEQSLSLQIAIVFDIFIWLMIATVFISMIYKHFGSLDVTAMKTLKD